MPSPVTTPNALIPKYINLPVPLAIFFPPSFPVNRQSSYLPSSSLGRMKVRDPAGEVSGFLRNHHHQHQPPWTTTSTYLLSPHGERRSGTQAGKVGGFTFAKSTDTTDNTILFPLSSTINRQAPPSFWRGTFRGPAEKIGGIPSLQSLSARE